MKTIKINTVSLRGTKCRSNPFKKIASQKALAMTPLIAFLFLSLLSFSQAQVQAQTLPQDTDWYTVGANYQRTSWVSEEVRGNLNVEWYQLIEPYIPYKVQPILTNNTAFISTSKGLYAFDLNSSSTQTKIKWVYPTELPLGHSPTVVTVNGRLTAYVGGHDRKVHAIDANSGEAIPGYAPYEAEAGFETNPLVINDTIYAGNRDGYFYALDALTGNLKWRFKTEGPILFSAAYKDNTLYFASQDNHAYALKADTQNPQGELIWKQGPFPGQGFHSYWPVIYTEKTTQKDYVVFGGSENYRQSDKSMQGSETEEIWPGCHNIGTEPCPPNGTTIGPESTASASETYWTSGTRLMNSSKIIDYYENKPWRRTVFILDTVNGQEYTFDSDNDGNREYAPFTYSNTTGSGNRHPAVVGGDGILYDTTMHLAFGWIPRGQVVGWKLGSHEISRVAGEIAHAIDEPLAYAGGGKLIYWNLCCDREAGAFDVTMPYGQSNRVWGYYGYDLLTKAPDYRLMYNDGIAETYNQGIGWQVYSGKNQSKNGVYSNAGVAQSPPIPYQGKVYILKGNALMAWNPTVTTRTQLPLAEIVPANPPAGGAPSVPTTDQLKQELAVEIQKFDTNGDGVLDHLKPGYHSAGFIDIYGQRGETTQYLGYGEIFDYFQNPAETVVTLLQAWPYLDPALQTQVKNYLQTNYGPGAPLFDFTKVIHVGWRDGQSRDIFAYPDDVVSNYTNFAPRTTPRCNKAACGWELYPPYSVYAAYKYAQVIHNGDRTASRNIFNTVSSKLEVPDDTFVLRKPYVLNQYLAGYFGYLKLQELAGLSETQSVKDIYNHLLDLRTNNFNKDILWNTHSMNGEYYKRTLSVAANFMYLVPEIGEYLNQNALAKVQEAASEYQYVAPYWFVPKFDASYGEGTLQHLYDYPSLFQAKAYALKEPYEELVKYLDVPAFQRGDLFYIQNLTAALQAGSPSPQPDPIPPGPVIPPPAAWYNSAWFYRKAIVIDHRNISSNQAEFPVLVSRVDNDLRDTAHGGKVAQANGNDLLFTDYNGTRLDYEIEKYDPVTGDLAVWVKLPAISSSSDTNIYLYYGNPSASSGQVPSSVWSNGYRGVWHLKEDPSGTAPQMQNSTITTGLNGTANGAMVSTDLVTGKTGNGTHFDGVNDYVSVPLNSSTLSSFTLSAWFKLNSVNGTKGILSWASTPTHGAPLILINHGGYSAGKLSIAPYGCGYVEFSQTVIPGVWYQVTLSRNAANFWSIYINGTLFQTSQCTANTGQNLYFGSGYNGSIDGIVDEVEIASTARSADWIAASYINQAYPDTFYIVGSQETAAATISGDINQDTQVNVLDIQACVNHILGIQDFGGRADVNSDGSVNVLDVQNVVNIILGA